MSSKNEIRRSITLTEEQQEAFRRLAEERGTSQAAVLAEAVGIGLEAMEEGGTADYGEKLDAIAAKAEEACAAAYGAMAMAAFFERNNAFSRLYKVKPGDDEYLAMVNDGPVEDLVEMGLGIGRRMQRNGGNSGFALADLARSGAFDPAWVGTPMERWLEIHTAKGREIAEERRKDGRG